MNMVYIETF